MSYYRDRSRSPRRDSFDGYRGGRRGGRRGGYRARDGAPPPTRVYENSVFVGNLPFETSWQDLKDHFRDAGDVLHADVLSYRGRSKGMGTVEFASREAAQHAIELFDRTEFDGREIFVREDLPPPEKGESRGGRFGGAREERAPRERAPPPPVDGFEVFVGNLPFSTTNAEFQELVGQLPTIKSSEIRVDRKGRSKGFGIILFDNKDDALKCIDDLNGRDVGGRPLEVREGRAAYSADAPPPSKNSEFTAGVSGNGSPSEIVFVDNLPWQTSDTDLYDLASSIAPVQKAEIQFDQIGRPSGAGVVQFNDTKTAAEACTKLDGYVYGHRPLRVSYARLPNVQNTADLPTGPASTTAAPVAPVAEDAPVAVDAAPVAAPEVAAVSDEMDMDQKPDDVVDQIEE